MDQNQFAKYISDRYEDQIRWYDRKAAINQKLYRWMQWTLIALAALTPILVELDIEPFGANGIRLATITGAIVAILTAGLKTFGYQENWLNYRTTCETLRKEEHFYAAGLDEYATTDDPEALFVERVESLIARENTMWVSTHRRDPDAEEGDDG